MCVNTGQIPSNTVVALVAVLACRWMHGRPVTVLKTQEYVKVMRSKSLFSMY